MGDRYVVLLADSDELPEDLRDSHSHELYWVLFDTVDQSIVDDDRMEPEDAILLRDLCWVPQMLNEKEAELTRLRAEVESLKSRLERLEAAAGPAIDALDNLLGDSDPCDDSELCPEAQAMAALVAAVTAHRQAHAGGDR